MPVPGQELAALGIKNSRKCRSLQHFREFVPNHTVQSPAPDNRKAARRLWNVPYGRIAIVDSAEGAVRTAIPAPAGSAVRRIIFSPMHSDTSETRQKKPDQNHSRLYFAETDSIPKLLYLHPVHIPAIPVSWE